MCVCFGKRVPPKTLFLKGLFLIQSKRLRRRCRLGQRQSQTLKFMPTELLLQFCCILHNSIKAFSLIGLTCKAKDSACLGLGLGFGSHSSSSFSLALSWFGHIWTIVYTAPTISWGGWRCYSVLPISVSFPLTCRNMEELNTENRQKPASVSVCVFKVKVKVR